MAGPDSHSPRRRNLVIVPAFNESESVGPLVEKLIQELPEYDVIVIDDGSTDDTAQQAHAHVTVVVLPFNLGIGGAMQAGYRYAAMHGYHIAVQVDGDGQHPPCEVRRLVAQLEATGSDMVIGSRFLQGRHYRQDPMRSLGVLVLRNLLRLLTGQTLTDCTSGFRAVGRDVIRAFAYWYPQDYPEPEVALLLHRAGFKITEHPVLMAPRTTGRTSIPLPKGVFYVLKVSVCLVLDMIRRPWPWRAGG